MERRFRKLVLHIGTHKTGTTAIQLALEEEAAALARTGVLVPRSGLLDACGHHALAEFLIHGADDATPQPLLDLLAELSDSPHETAVLSSENFSLLFAYPKRLENFARELAAIDFETTVVLYVREQAALAESLYAELLKHGLMWSFDAFVAMLLERGRIDGTERLHFPFEYGLLARRFEAAFGERSVVVYPYRAAAPPAALLDEFWEHLGTARELSGAGSRRPNRRFTLLASLDALYRHVAALDPGAPDPRAIARAAGIDPRDLERPVELLDAAGVERIRAHFAAANAALAERYGAAIPLELERSASPDAGRRVFRAAAERWKLPPP